MTDPDCGTCGDGATTGNEYCDGTDLDDGSCATFGYAGGTLTCTAECLPDLSACDPGICEESCQFSGDGECDDGGPGAQFSVCTLGSDCADCGPR